MNIVSSDFSAILFFWKPYVIISGNWVSANLAESYMYDILIMQDSGKYSKGVFCQNMAYLH